MVVAVVPVSLWLCWLLAWRRPQLLGFPHLSRRGALIAAFALWQMLLVAITELSSLGGHLTAGALTAAWISVCVALALLVRENPRARHSPRRLRAGPLDVALGAVVALVFLSLLAGIGWIYPPNNGDSMVYHLARVENWIQNQSVHPYATHYLANVELGPLNSYAFVNLHLLAGTDRLDGYLQWIAVVVCCLGVSELGRLLGLGCRGQAFAAVLCLTIPNVILEATSTQNNDLAAAVGVALVFWLAAPHGPATIRRAVGVGSVGGLAVLAKGTLIALLGPVVVVLLVLLLRGEGRRSGARKLMRQTATATIAAGIAACGVAAPFLLRNVEMFGSVSGPVTASTPSTGLSAEGAMGNVLRSAAMHFDVGDGGRDPISLWSRAVLAPTGRLFEVVGPDPADQHYFLGAVGENPFMRRDYAYFERTEEFGANPATVTLIAVTGGTFLTRLLRGRRDAARAAALAAGLAAGFVLFAATARWSPFAARYQIPSLVLWCPLVALAMRSWPRVGARAVAVLVVVLVLPALLDNTARSLTPPENDFDSPLARYFAPKEKVGVIPRFEDATRAVAASGCTRVGLPSWVLREYPVWAGLRAYGWDGMMRAVGVTNQTARYEDLDFRPCALIGPAEATEITSAPGMASWRNRDLAWSIDVELVEPGTVAPGFAGAEGISLLPGAGWTLTELGPTSFTPGAVLHLSTLTAAVVDLELVLAPGETGRGLVVESAERIDRARRSVILRGLSIPAGRSELRLAGLQAGRSLRIVEMAVRPRAAGRR